MNITSHRSVGEVQAALLPIHRCHYKNLIIR